MNRIKQLRREHNITQNKLCEKLGITQGALSGWETERYEPDISSLRKMSKLFDVSIDYILGQSNERNIDSSNIKKYRIPVYGAVAAGIPIEAIEDVVDWEEIDEATFKKGVIALKIKGNSMEPRICDGDVVIVQKQTFIDDGQIAVVMVNGNDATCKKIKHSPAGMTLISLNPAYEPMFYSKDDVINLPVKILGKVIELRGKF